MEIVLLVVGETSTPYIVRGIDEYMSRLKRYISYSVITIPDVKNSGKLTALQQKDVESEQILSRIEKSDYLVLLDERGKMLTSLEFAEYLQKKMASGLKRLVYVVGGPYGFGQKVYDRADALLSLSKMTFTHEMVRLFFSEQLYRAMTILRGEPYHHK